jgi:endonuclease/exonuclease/phosphatase family metal-dependent hydrolase
VQSNTSRWARGIAFILAAGPVILCGSGCNDWQESAADGEADGAAESALARNAELSIVAWNMEHFPLTESTPELVAGALAEMRPDVVGVQEIENDATFLAMVGSVSGYAAVIADDPKGHSRVGVIYRKARVTVSEVETLFTGDRYTFPRPPLKAHVAVKGTDVDFDFVAVHLKAMGDAKSEARRKAACHALEGWIDGRLAGGADPDIVIAGDWNDRITEPQEQNVFKAFLDVPGRYRFLTHEVADAGDFSYIPYSSLIDHVLVTTSLLDAYGDGATEAVHLEDSVTGYLKQVSDHRPVRARFALP